MASKASAAAREENAHFVSEFTKLDFRRRFGSEVLLASFSSTTGGKRLFLSRCKPAPARVMISTRAEYANDIEHSSTVLLEYGLKYQMKDSLLMLQHAGDIEGDAEMQRDVAKMQEDEHREQAMLDALLGQMAQHREKSKLPSSVLNSVIQSAGSQQVEGLNELPVDNVARGSTLGIVRRIVHHKTKVMSHKDAFSCPTSHHAGLSGGSSHLDIGCRQMQHVTSRC